MSGWPTSPACAGTTRSARCGSRTSPAGWVEQFDRWFTDAVAAELPEPNAAVLATADADGGPDARLVLLKGYDATGFVFGTSYASAKGAQLTADPRASLVLPWHAMQRQVRVRGHVERVGETASDALWDPRPRGAQLAAAASVQSTVVSSHDELADRVRLPRPADPRGLPCLGRRPGAATACCPRWSSSGRAARDRLHDRIRFRRGAAGSAAGGWVVERLAP